LVWLERRTLLALLADLPAQAVPLSLGSPLAATIAPLAATYYSVSSDTGSRLTATLDLSGFAARLSLVDAEGRPLVQSDGPAPGAADGLIDVNVPAGTDYLEVQSLSGGGTYQISANLIPAVPTFQTVPTYSTVYNPIAAGQFFGSSLPVDLVASDGIHVGNGDGTFQNTPVYGQLAQKNWTVTAIAVGDFNQDNLPDIAFTEIKIGPDGRTTAAQLCVLQNEGGGHFQPSTTLPVDSEPVAIQTIRFGNGIFDLAVADSKTGRVRIFKRNGQGGFSPGPVLTGGVRPSGLVADDRFGDSHVDLIIADEGDPNTGQGQGLTVFRADGPDSFQPSGTIDAGFGPSAIVAGDFRGNGVLDLAVADSNSGQVSVLLNNGNGTFQAPRFYRVGSKPLALVAGSFTEKRTHDGKPVLDLAVANTNSNDLSVLLGNGDGTFQPQLLFGAGSFPAWLVTADFNSDGRLDLATGNQGLGDVPGSGDISILLGQGGGYFQVQSTNPVGMNPVGTVTADLNHDGHTDIITANSNSNDISVLLGNGDGTFQAARSFPAGERPTALAVADFNGDGRLDVAVADGGENGDGGGVSILMGNGDGTFQAPVFYPAGATPYSIVAGDWTGSRVIDLAVANKDSPNVTVFMGDGRGGFRALPPISLGDQASDPVAITAGDFTGNGVRDLAVVDQGSNRVSILLNDGRGNFLAQQPPISLGDDPLNVHFPMAIVAGDFTGNRILDLAVASALYDGEPDNVSILLGDGNGNFSLKWSIPLGTFLSPSSITAGHFFGGGPLDLAVADFSSNKVSLLQGDGQGGFQVSALDLGGGIKPYVVAKGDFTGNGRDDLAIATQSPNSVEIELNQGNGQFAQPGSVGLATHNTPVVADFNRDLLPDVAIVDGAGDILFRQGRPNQPGSFDPPVMVNPGRPSRDIAAVRTSQGTLLASVDAKDNAVSLFSYRNGGFSFVGSLATDSEPAQIVSADLMSKGEDDLVIRNAGDGTLTVYMSDGQGGFLAPSKLTAGPGISDVSVADVNQDGLRDILLANLTAGEVEVILNQGAAGFSPNPVLYRAGVGLSAVTGGTGETPLSLSSQEATAGVADGFLAPGDPPYLVALNSGSGTIGILDGLGGGRFANPTWLPTDGPSIAIRVADFDGNGDSDLAILGPNGLSIWLGNEKGGFVPGTTPPYDVGPNATGLAIAYLNGNKIPNLVVGNSFGDVRALLNEGNGVFQPPVVRNVGLAVSSVSSNSSPTLIIADQGRDQVVVQNGLQKQRTVLADSTSGLLVPGSPVLADLNGRGILDLIVPNSGSNNVLVYPGRGNGQFGPELNGGKGFVTGTDPVGVTVANLNGRPDLVVADEGSNDVTILLNQATTHGGFTFVPGPRLNLKTATQQGIGPLATAIVPSSTGGPASLAVSMSGSKQLWVIPGVGGGFFNDQNPTVFNVGTNPGQILFGNFDGRPDLVTLNAGSNDLTLISDFASPDSTISRILSQGVDPETGFSFPSGDGFDSLVVGNTGDGVLALFLGGSGGLSFSTTMTESDVPSPTALAFSGLTGGQVQFFAATAGLEEAIPLALTIPPGPPNVAQLVPLNASSLSLVGTLLIVSVQTSENESGLATNESVASTTAALLTGPAPSVGQSVSGQNGSSANGDDVSEERAESRDGPTETERVPASAPSRADSIWKRYLLGIDDAQEPQSSQDHTDPPSATEDGPSALVVPWRTGDRSPETAAHPGRGNVLDAVDSVLRLLMEDYTRSERVTSPLPRVSLRPTPEEARSTDAFRFVPLAPDPARPCSVPLSIVSEPTRKEQIVVSLSMVVIAVEAGRVLSSVQARDVSNVERFQKAFRRF
jgi:hypothetical protein